MPPARAQWQGAPVAVAVPGGPFATGNAGASGHPVQCRDDLGAGRGDRGAHRPPAPGDELVGARDPGDPQDLGTAGVEDDRRRGPQHAQRPGDVDALVMRRLITEEDP